MNAPIHRLPSLIADHVTQTWIHGDILASLS
jgi:hypothetical protein